MSDTTWRDFSLLEGGLVHRLGRLLQRPNSAGYLRLGIGLALLAWLPLFVLAAFAQALTSGPAIPFVESLATHVQLLLAIPLLFAAEAGFEVRGREVIRAMGSSQLVPAPQLPRLERALAQASLRRHAWLLELALVILVVILIVQGVRFDPLDGIASWDATAAGAPTPAGWWYRLVSLPIYQFVVFRWCARLLLWGHLLWRVSRLDLALMPAHPDLAGGLGTLAVAHAAFAPLSIAVSSVMAATLAEELLHGRIGVPDLVAPMAVTVIGSTCVLVAPLLFFTTKLVDARQRGLIDYGVLATSYTRSFDAKWLRRDSPPAEPLLGSPDIQSLADLANAFEVIGRMRVVPIGRVQLIVLVGAAVVPMLPLILFVIPLDELIFRVIQAFVPL